MSRFTRLARSLSCVVLLAAVIAAPAADAPPQANVEVRFTDGSILKLALTDARIEVTTPYGKLAVPVGDVRKIDFASRLTDETARRIEEAVANLADPTFSKREAASAELLKLRERAYPALLEAAKNKDAEVARRAGELLERIREDVPAEQLEVRKADVVHTADSKFSGRIEGSALKARSAQFGDVQVKLTDVRSLRVPGFAEEEPVVAVADADPGNLSGFQDKLGKTFFFRVTGAQTGVIWGTDAYTADSHLATAAVHAGVLRAGQTGVVKVTIVAGTPGYTGTMRNGVTSQSFGFYGTAFKVSK
jgi:hypothetical protein